MQGSQRFPHPRDWRRLGALVERNPPNGWWAYIVHPRSRVATATVDVLANARVTDRNGHQCAMLDGARIEV